MSHLCVLVRGNLSEGFRFIGPFADFDAAAQFSEGDTANTWIATLEPTDLPAAFAMDAAPELLAALKSLMELYVNGQLIIEGEADEGDDPVIGNAMKAIAKAEGRGE